MRTCFSLTFVAALLLTETSCFWRKKPSPAPPVTQTAPASKPSPQKRAPAAATKPVQRRKPARRVRAAKPPEQPKTAPEPPKPAAPPQLSEMLTEEERSRLSATVVTRLASARRNLASLEKATLTADQMETVLAIRAFISRAEEVRNSDMNLAAQLAYRAEVLSNSLAAGVR